MDSNKIRKKFLDFFEKKGHKIVPSGSLLPVNDPTTLFTGSGMQQMMPYLLGEKNPLGTRIADSQKCFRAQDIEDVGDNRHTTFFEMLGNWSFGDYFKKEQISWIFSFLIDELKLDPKRIYITCFRGSGDLPKDEEAAELWQKEFKSKGIEAEIVDFPEENGMGTGRIFYYDERKNWWSRSGIPSNMPLGEPGGPDSEIFWDMGAELKLHEVSKFKNDPCHVNCDCGRFLEIGNSVFMKYIKTANGFDNLPKTNIDFGGGLERITIAAQEVSDIFLIDSFDLARKKLEELSGKKYGQNETETYAFRVILDHIRAATFLIGDGAFPSNKDQGYFTRRLIRRAVRYGKILGLTNFCGEVSKEIIRRYGNYELDNKTIIPELEKEEKMFNFTLFDGLRMFEKITEGKSQISGKDAFLLFQSYGFPIEITEELAREKSIPVDKEGFKTEFKKHKDISKKGLEQKFKGGLLDNSRETTKLHTATHLLNEALRKVVSPDIKQRGSNITRERLRFDFNFSKRLSPDEIKKVEDMINKIISQDLEVVKTDMPLKEALDSGAEAEFGTKYPDIVSVYKIGDFSKEICAGPHAKRTSELGCFKILKEESSGAGARRIKAILK
jgi:alanyl-tRNA synthetase